MGHDVVEELMHSHEVLAAHVPVSLLAVDRQRDQIVQHRGEVLLDAARAVQVVLRCGNAELLGSQCSSPISRR